MNGWCACGGTAPLWGETAPVNGWCACGGTALLCGGTAPVNGRCACGGVWEYGGTLGVGGTGAGAFSHVRCGGMAVGADSGSGLASAGFTDDAASGVGWGASAAASGTGSVAGAGAVPSTRGVCAKGFSCSCIWKFLLSKNGQHSLRHTGEMLPVIFGKSVVLFQVVIALAAEVGAFPRIPVRSVAA